MKSNIEIKARAASLKELKQKVQEICTADPVMLNQKDIYYLSRIGRLKLRIFSDNEGELISYKRDNIRGPKKSEYWIYKTSEPIQLYNTLSDTLDIIGVVEKKRLVYITGQTRIHLDEVKDLGTFLELEVVLIDGQNPKEGEQIADNMMQSLGIDKVDLIERSYIDLIMDKHETQKIQD